LAHVALSIRVILFHPECGSVEISAGPTTKSSEHRSGDLAQPIALKELVSFVSAVASYDGCADIWLGFFGLVSRFWPDLPYPLYLISNHVAYSDERVTSLRVGDDLSWSEILTRGLERVPVSVDTGL
jgi:hypothetical protein